MKEQLWYVTDGVRLIGVYESKKEAMADYREYEDEDDFEYYDIYGIDVDEIEEYPNEYDLALDEGLIEY